jgi:hypothetical protein
MRKQEPCIVEKQKPVSIQVTFTMPHGITTVETFESTNTPMSRLGTTAEKMQTPVTPGSVGYSGRHDHGPLPSPREGGAYAQLIGCVTAAKDFSNSYLTDVMKQEKSRKNDHQEVANKKSKSSN